MKAETLSLLPRILGSRARFACVLAAVVATPMFGCAGQQHRTDNNAQGSTTGTSGETGDTSGNTGMSDTSGSGHSRPYSQSGQYGQGEQSGQNGQSGNTWGPAGTGNSGTTDNQGMGTGLGSATGSQQVTINLDSKSGSRTTGTATFMTDAAGKVTLKIDLKNAPPGAHGVHIHETGDCSSTDGESAGPHWNPKADTHGKMGKGHHMGDVGNITVGSDGTGTLTITSDQWTLGAGGMNDVTGHAVVVHLKGDDFTTQPSGGSGGRIACGVITKK